MNEQTTATQEKPAAGAAKPQERGASKGAPTRGGGDGARRPRNERGPRRSRRQREPRARSEFENKLIDIRRVTRVMAGGRRFSFSVSIVIGNGRGKVGVGIGKASDTALAIEKATRDAQRNLVVYQ
jgi:small subunit ribosomal protein S5